MQDSLRDYSAGITLSVIGHGLLFLVMGLTVVLRPAPIIQPVQLAIKAALVQDDELIRQRQLQEEKRRAEQERVRVEEEQRRQQEVRKQKEEEQRQAEEERKKLEQIELTERRKEEEVERKKQAEEQKRREAEQRKAEEQAQQEKERQAAEQKQREAVEASRAAERESELQAQLAEEELRQAAVQSGLLDQWAEVIRQRVQRNWVRPASAKPGLECEVRVSQIPGGEVVDVRLGRCNGDAAVIRSIENAVYRSSPLPPPADPSLFERTLIFDFKPEE
jgi:colicin import membrane protein